MTQIKVICGYDVEEKSSEVVETSEVFYFAFGQERMTTRGWNPLRHSLWSQRKALGGCPCGRGGGSHPRMSNHE